MSANLDLVRSILEPWERGDFSSVVWAHPDHEYEIVGGPTPGKWKGLAAMREAWATILNAWEDWTTIADVYEEVDERRVIVFTHSTARGRTSGMAIPPAWTRGAVLFEIAEGKVVRHVVYLDGRERAIAEVGRMQEADAEDSRHR
jgi:ketosteroid isomerase-like protein